MQPHAKARWAHIKPRMANTENLNLNRMEVFFQQCSSNDEGSIKAGSKLGQALAGVGSSALPGWWWWWWVRGCRRIIHMQTIIR